MVANAVKVSGGAEAVQSLMSGAPAAAIEIGNMTERSLESSVHKAAMRKGIRVSTRHQGDYIIARVRAERTA